jgi:hypothetical protein
LEDWSQPAAQTKTSNKIKNRILGENCIGLERQVRLGGKHGSNRKSKIGEVDG